MCLILLYLLLTISYRKEILLHFFVKFGNDYALGMPGYSTPSFVLCISSEDKVTLSYGNSGLKEWDVQTVHKNYAAVASEIVSIIDAVLQATVQSLIADALSPSFSLSHFVDTLNLVFRQA
jgi:hypothetical protein